MMRRRGRLQGTRYQRAEGVQHSVAELLQLARLPRPAPDHGCESLLRVPQGGQRYGPPPQSAGGGWGNPVAFAVPGYRDSIRPHSRRGVVVGAETTRVGGGGGAAAAGNIQPSRSGRRRARPAARPARGTAPCGGGSRGAVFPHIQLARHPPKSELETTFNMCVAEGYRQRLQRRVS